MEQIVISGVCKIRSNKLFFNDELLFHDENASDFSHFIKNAYRHIHIGYPKFFKMDNLSKLGFLAADVLLKKCVTDKSSKQEDTGIVIANSSSSLDTDFIYFDSIKDNDNYFPSPSVFVYTLPNIMTGEICIRHKMNGENAFFVSEKFDPEFIHKYVTDLFETGKVQKCLTGWVELMDNSYEAVLFFVEKNITKTDENVKFESGNISRIYFK